MVDNHGAAAAEQILFAATAMKPRKEMSAEVAKGAELVAREDLVQDGIEYEFEWQRTGQDRKPPVRKRMLCHTLRRLLRLRMAQGFHGVEEHAELFTGAHNDLRIKGEQIFTADLNSSDLKKQQ